MTSTPRTKFLLAVLATGVLAIGAIATSVAAKPGDDGPRGAQGSPPACDHPANATVQKRCDEARMKEQRKEVQQDRKDLKDDRKQLKEDRKELRDQVKDFCEKAAANSTASQRCDHLKDAVKARRVAHALLSAIRVHERELGRIDFRIEMAKERIASGNLTGNQTSEAQDRLAHLEVRHDRLVEKLKDEQAKLAALRDRWSEVKDHLKDREERGEDNGGVDAEGEVTLASSSTSTSAAA
jgi:chromosome segregation ATPase